MKSEIDTLQKEKDLLLLMQELQKCKNEWNSLYYTYQQELGEIKTKQRHQQEEKQKSVNTLYHRGTVSLKMILFMVINLLVLNTIAPYPPYSALFSALYDLTTFILTIYIIHTVFEKVIPILTYPFKKSVLKQKEREKEKVWGKRLQKKQNDIDKLFIQAQEMKAEISYLYAKEYINEQFKSISPSYDSKEETKKDLPKQKVKKRNLNH